MNIGIDARTLRVQGGSKTYAINLLKNIKKRENIILFGIDKFEDYKCIDESLNQQNPIFRLYYDFIKLPKLLQQHNITIFHGLKGIGKKIKKIKTIITMHDVIFLYLQQTMSFKDIIYWKYISMYFIKRADKIISVSYATKNDLVKNFGIHEDKIIVTHESFDKNIFKIREGAFERTKSFLKTKNIDITDTKILLNVNTVSPRKNIQNIIKAFNEIGKKYNDVILIIAGRKGWKIEKILDEYEKSPFKNRIHFIGNTNIDELVDLYNTAFLSVYPSFYEGFGLPILESQACGCPVITSNISSMPEIAGESAILVDPYSVDDISQGFKRLLNDESLRQGLIQKGFKNCERFSWEKCAGDTFDLYLKND